jgi:hypothetical protein
LVLHNCSPQKPPDMLWIEPHQVMGPHNRREPVTESVMTYLHATGKAGPFLFACYAGSRSDRNKR